MPFSESDVSKILTAVRFAAEKHRDQKRKSAEGWPYVNHPIEVADILWHIGGVRDVDVIVAGLLHDTIEDTDATSEEIENLFGEKILGLVQEVTDDKSLEKSVRKQRQVETAPHKSPGAKLVKLADKISNIGAMATSPPKDWSLERRREYVEWGKKVITGLRGINPALEAKFDQAAAEALKNL